MAAVLNKIGAAVGSQMQVGSVGFSLAYGAAWGVGLSAIIAGGRAMYVTTMDKNHWKLQSRQR